MLRQVIEAAKAKAKEVFWHESGSSHGFDMYGIEIDALGFMGYITLRRRQSTRSNLTLHFGRLAHARLRLQGNDPRWELS